MITAPGADRSGDRAVGNNAVWRADQIGSKTEAGRTFVDQPSGRVLIGIVVSLLVLRSLLGPLAVADLILVGVTIALVGPFEWLVHRFLLHAPADSARMKTLGTGRGHVEHHEDPAELQWLMLDWRDAAVFSMTLGVLAALFAVPTAVLLDANRLATFATAWSAAAIGLLHYEWVHLLVHTRYRCRSRYYAALERHHRLHHYRNEHYWLGVTARSGDRLFRTMPERRQVELSATARSLGRTARSGPT